MTQHLRKQALAGIASGTTAPVAPVAPAVPAQPRPVVGINAVSNELHRQFNNPALEAAILANIDRETGGTFDYRIWQGYKKQTFDPAKKQKGGYGLFQLTGSNLDNYKSWLNKGKQTDSAANQIGFMKSVYGPGRTGWKKNTGANPGMDSRQLADWWHRRVETPAHVLQSSKYYNPARIQQATQRHNNFMTNKIKSVNGVWQEVKK